MTSNVVKKPNNDERNKPLAGHIGNKKRSSHDLLTYAQRIKDRWYCGNKLGEGGCGAVYEVFDLYSNAAVESQLHNGSTSNTSPTTTTNEDVVTVPSAELDALIKKECSRYALKVERFRPGKDCVLKMEAKVLRAAKSSRHCCRLFDCGKKPDYTWIIMTLLGQSLTALRNKNRTKRFTTCTTVRIGIQTLQAITDLHNVGFVHRDIKPSNFAINRTTNGERQPVTVYVLDFGLCREYMNNKKEVKKPRNRVYFRGTYRYCSPIAQERLEQSRKDDLCSWLYMLIEINHGLPWSHTRNAKEVLALKKDTPDESLLKGSPKEYAAILQHIKTIDYYAKPNYAMIQHQLQRTMQRKGYEMADPYDWEEGGGENAKYSRRDEDVNVLPPPSDWDPIAGETRQTTVDANTDTLHNISTAILDYPQQKSQTRTI